MTHVFEKLNFWSMAYSRSESTLLWFTVGCSAVFSWSHSLSQRCVGAGYALRVFLAVTRLMIYRWPQFGRRGDLPAHTARTLPFVLGACAFRSRDDSICYEWLE